MDIEKNLRQLHKIEPDPAYARGSRVRLMMAMPQVPKITLKVLVFGMLRSGSAMAAIGLIFFFAVGGSIWNLVISPVTGWDSLQAEAQAIDTQIHLADLQYNDPGYERQRLISPKTNFSSLTIKIANGSDDLEPAAVATEDTDAASSTDAVAEDDTNATSTDAIAGDDTAVTSTPVEIDTTINVEEALDILSQ